MEKNYLYNLLYEMTSFLFPLITTPYISRRLGAAAIGEYSFTYSLSSYFVLIAVFGCHVQGQRDVAYHHNDKEGCTKTFIMNMGLKTCMAVLAISMYAIFCLFERKYIFLLLIQGIYIFASYVDITWFFQGLEEFRLTLLRNLFVKITGTILIFLFVKDEKDLWLYALFLSLTTLLGNISLWFCLPKYLVKIKYKLYIKRSYFVTALELFIPIISIQVYSITDRAMLGFMLDTTEENGFYEQAQRILRILMTISTSMGTVLLPRISILFEEKSFEKIKDILRKTIVIILALTCPMMVGMIVIIDDFIPLFLGDGYGKVVILLKILSPILVISGICNILGNGVLIPIGKHNKATIATIAGAIINILLNILFIGKYLSIGASVASVIAEFIVFYIHFYYVKKYIDLHFLTLKVVRYIAIAAFMGGLVGILQCSMYSWSIVIRIMVSIAFAVIIYLIVLFILQDEVWKVYVQPVVCRFLHKENDK